MTPEIFSAIGAVLAVLTGMGGMFAWMWRQMDKRFDKIDARFEQVDALFESIDQKLVDIKADITDMKIAIARLEGTQPPQFITAHR